MKNVLSLVNDKLETATTKADFEDEAVGTTGPIQHDVERTIIQMLLRGSLPPGGGGDLEARVVKLESSVEHIQNGISDIKTDVREIRNNISGIRPEMIKWFFVTALSIVGILMGFISWVKI